MTSSFRVTSDGTVRPVYLYTVDIDEFVGRGGKPAVSTVIGR